MCGTGAHGAYHAGVLRALQEAGVKIDVVAGQGVGAGAAALAAIDGAARLWDTGGLWRNPRVGTLYHWKWTARVAGWLALLAIVALVLPLLYSAFASDSLLQRPSRLALLTALAAVIAIAACVAFETWRAPVKRRTDGRVWWRIAGAPLDARRAAGLFLDTIAQLIPGTAGAASRLSAGRRYAEALADSLGQPGFRELMIVATDLDSRRDVVAALLREPYRRDFIAPRPERERRSEAFDLTGAGRDHALDIVAAALTPPLVCEPHLLTFASDSYWRGETHRFCDRPGALSRLLDELAAAGVSQAIVVSAVPRVAAPHRLRSAPLGIRQRLGDFLSAAESASLRDGLETARLRFDSIYVIAPSHNAVGPFDVAGAYDEASDRRQDLVELIERGYEDAYHAFIEPIVGASGEQLARASSAPGVIDDLRH